MLTIRIVIILNIRDNHFQGMITLLQIRNFHNYPKELSDHNYKLKEIVFFKQINLL
jgi:hypothetical protein